MYVVHLLYLVYLVHLMYLVYLVYLVRLVYLFYLMYLVYVNQWWLKEVYTPKATPRTTLRLNLTISLPFCGTILCRLWHNTSKTKKGTSRDQPDGQTWRTNKCSTLFATEYSLAKEEHAYIRVVMTLSWCARPPQSSRNDTIQFNNPSCWWSTKCLLTSHHILYWTTVSALPTCPMFALFGCSRHHNLLKNDTIIYKYVKIH